MFSGFADSSTVTAKRTGASPGGRVFSIAGVVAPVGSWEEDFAPAWEGILRRERIAHFHMTDYESRRIEPYKSWSNEKRVSFLVELFAIIERTEAISRAVTLDLDAYEGLTAAQRARIGHPYRFCGALCIMSLSKMLQSINTFEPVAYVFEAGDTGSGELKRTVDSLSKEKMRDLQVKSFAYGDKDEFIQLQAADVMAYETAKAGLRDIGADHRVHRKSLRAIGNVLPAAGYLFDAQELTEWIADNRDPFGYLP